MKFAPVIILTAIVTTICSLASFLEADSSSNLLWNPGFEERTEGWQSYGGTLDTFSNPVKSGEYAAILIGSEAEAFIYQTVPISPGDSYIFGGWVYQNNIYPKVVFLRISWFESLNGCGEEIGHDDSLSLIGNTDDYYSFLTTFTCIAPDNAHSATVKGIVESTNPNQPASVRFDDMAFVEVVPTPTPTPAPTCHPNLLLNNPGFEEGHSSWLAYGGTFSIIDSPVQDGASAAALISDTPSTIWLYQVVPIQGGGKYTLCGYAVKNDPNIERIFLRISWYDSDDGYGTEISHTDSFTTLTDDQPQYRLLSTTEVTAPLKAKSARIKAILTPLYQTPVTAYFDDFSFVGPSPTPAPTPTPPPTPSPTPSLTPTPTATPSPTPTATPSPTPALKPTPTPTPTLRPTPRPTPSPTFTPTPLPSPTPAITPTPAAIPAGIGDVLINEVQYDPLQAGVDSAFEWLELMNCTDHAIDLTDWRIADNVGTNLIPSLILPARSFAIIAASADFYTNFSDFSGIVVFISDGSIGNGLSNTGDCLILSDPTGKVIDALSYGDNTNVFSPPCPDVSSGHSLERQPAGWDTDQASDFIDNASPSPGDGLASPTSTLTPTPEITPAPSPTPSPTPTITSTPTPTPTPTPSPTNSPAPQPVTAPANEGDIVINEIQYDPPQSGVDYSFEWIEILNCTEHPIDLSGWKIADNHDVDSIPSLILPAGRYAIIAASADFYTDFPGFNDIITFIEDGKIGNGLGNDGDRLILTDPTGKIIDALSYGSDTTIMLPSCQDVHEGHSLERQPAGMDTNKASDFINNEAPSPSNGLLSATPTPTPTMTVSPASLPTPAASSEPLPATTAPAPSSTYTPTITAPPAETLIGSTNKVDPWIQLKIPLVLFIVGLTLFTAVFWLKK